MLSKKILAIVFLIVLLSPTFVRNFAMGQNEKENYCPESVDKKYCHKVIIIGAGMAGLGAAKELQSNGYDDFVILEARSDPGGRVVTTPVCDLNEHRCYSYDTHASFISGYEGNPIYTLAKYYNTTGNILTKISDYKNKMTFVDTGHIVDDERQKRMDQTYENFKTWMNETRQKMTMDKPLQDAIDEFSMTLKNETDRKDFAFEISYNIGSEYADDPANMSWLYWDKIGYKPGGEDNPDKVFPHGFADIVKGLVSEIPPNDIRYETSVTLVNYNDHGVTVETDKGTYYGQYVISTIPIWDLQDKQSPLFNPPIPKNKADAIDKMHVGTLAQTYIYFKNGTFWNDVDWLYYVPPLNETGHFTIFENMDRVNGVPMIMAFNYGKYAKDMLTYPTNNQIKKDLLKSLSHMYPDKVRKLSMNDMEIIYRGDIEAYSSVPVNFTVPGDFNLLASSLVDNTGTNRVFFAGEATTWHYPQTTHGAYLTGLREANRVMITDTGKYPSPSFQGNNWLYPKNFDNSTWSTFPEYVICKPDLVVVQKNNPEKTLICVEPDTAKALFNRNFTASPTWKDPAQK